MDSHYTIGQLAGAVSVPTSTVRYYERCGLVEAERRTESNYRVYGEPALERMRFILAAKAHRLRGFCAKCLPTFARALARIDPRPTTDAGTRTLARVYDRMPCRGFSREVLAPHARGFSVIPVGDCGWSDLGTPARLVMFRRLQNGRTQPGRLAAESIPTCRAD